MKIITTFRSFDNPRYKLIQRNAVYSWLQLQPKPDVIVFGNDHPGTVEICQEFGFNHVTDLACSKRGTPLANDVFAKASELAQDDLIMWVSSDIILLQGIMDVISALKDKGPLIAAARRQDTQFDYSIENDSDWVTKIANEPTNFGAVGAGDLFIFTSHFLKDIPPFAIGKAAVDSWMMWEGIRQNVFVDITPSAKVIHQWHDSGNKLEVWDAGDFEDFHENQRLWYASPAAYYPKLPTIDSANLVLVRGELREI